MKRARKMLSVLLCMVMVLTSVYVSDQAANAADNSLEETSLLSGTVTSSTDASRGTGDSYDGFIATCSNTDADYLKITYIVEDTEALEEWTGLFNFQPYTSSWGGWQSNLIALQDSTCKDGVYTAYISVDTIKASCIDGDVAGINVCYVENPGTEVTLTGFYSCMGEMSEAAEKSILTSSVTSSKDSSRGTGDDYDSYIASFFDITACDYLKITYTLDDASGIEAHTSLFNFMPYNSSWGGWDSNLVTTGDSTLEDGVYSYCISIKDIAASLSDGELWGINLCYVESAADVSLTGFYACTGSISGGSEEAVTDKTFITDKEIPSTRSNQYVAAMGQGWNLGNSFDGFDADLNCEDQGELAWGNPAVTKELIQAVKAKGFDSIRMPMTIYRRYSEKDGTYRIDESWLARYKEVVDWAVDEGLYVMVNIHHDSWTWLASWDGNTSSKEYVMFTQFWQQLASYFKDEPDQVCFETINEPYFDTDTGSITKYEKLDRINLAAYNTIRQSGGNNGTRMIVMPTYNTNHGFCDDLYNLIDSLEDENIIATIHYYSEYHFGANLGTTSFDDGINGGEETARELANAAFTTTYQTFTANGIGVIVGEWGLLGNDSGVECNEIGEELKYDEYINEVARKDGFCLMMWDNGSYIDRTDTVDYSWKNERIGNMVETSLNERSSTTDCLDILYFNEETTEDVLIPLRINGPEFKGIKGLTEGTDYTYDETAKTITLSASYVNAEFAKMDSNTYGNFADLIIQFTSGADWHEYLCKFGSAEAGEAAGTTDSITIPVTYNGTKVRRVGAYQRSGAVGPDHSWCRYLQFGKAFAPDYENGTFTLKSLFLSDASVMDGPILVNIEMWDGQMIPVWLNKNGSVITCSDEYAENTQAAIRVADTIYGYTGETGISSDYLSIPEGASVYGTWSGDSSIAAMEGWPAAIHFGNTASDVLTDGGVAIHYYDVLQYVSVKFGVKAKPVVNKVTFTAGVQSWSNVVVENLAEDAVVTYSTEDASISFILDENQSSIFAANPGTTTVTATVTQYGRTDAVTATVTVEEGASTTAAPTATPAPTPTSSEETPVPSIPAETTQVPVSETPVPSVPAETTEAPIGIVPDVSVSTTEGGYISQTYTIKSGPVDYDLADLSIRFYYTKDGNKEQVFWVDNAGISYSSDPWYVNYTSAVNYNFTDEYVEISFNQSRNIGTGTLTLQARFNQSDWSGYTNFKAGKVVAYMNGQAVSTVNA